MSQSNRSHALKTLAMGVVGGLLAHLVVLATESRAAPALDQIERRLPYSGTLDWDGAPYTGATKMAFDLFDSANAGKLVWTEQQSVAVFNGQFSVRLGDGTPAGLEAALITGKALWLQVTVQRLDSAGKAIDVPGVTLSGRQRLNPVPYAVWATNAANFNVAGDAAVVGHLITGSLKVNANLSSGPIDASSITASGQIYTAMTATAQSAVIGDSPPGGTADQMGLWKSSAKLAAVRSSNSDTWFSAPSDFGTVTVNIGAKTALTVTSTAMTTNVPLHVKGCPSGYKSVTTNGGLCMSNVAGNSTKYLFAQGLCFDMGAHVCTHTEWFLIGQNQGPISNYNGEWIGNMVDNDTALVIDGVAFDNFETTALKDSSHKYHCCIGYSGIQ